MFTIKRLEGMFTEYELKDEEYGSAVRIAPEKGGVVTSFSTGGKEALYLDRERLAAGDITAGGNPVLFPICSALKGGKYTCDGREYAMEFHGFARNSIWQVKGSGMGNEGNEGFIALELKDGPSTRACYPFSFEVLFKYILDKNVLLIDQEYKNTGSGDMPFYTGFHPYFNVSDKFSLKLDIPADSYYDYNTGGLETYKGFIDFGKPVDHVFPLRSEKVSICSMTDPGEGRSVIIEMSEHFKWLVVWTMSDRDFLCIEPWMAPPDAMNTGDSLCKLGPGQSMKAWVKIMVEQL